MSYRIGEIAQVMEELAPEALAYDWDNVGLQIGSYDQKVDRVLVTLTVTEQIVKKARYENVGLVISHHPLIFKPLKALHTDTPLGRVVTTLVAADIALYVSHTNLDQAPQGLNMWLADALNLVNHKVLMPSESQARAGLGRIGDCGPMTLGDLATMVERVLQTKVRLCGETTKVCQRVAVCSGSGGSLVSRASAQGADVLVTGDVDYHEALEAVQRGLAVIDASHYGTERLMVDKVAEYLQNCLPRCTIITSLEGNNPFSAMTNWSGGKVDGR